MDLRYKASVAALSALATEGYVDLSDDDIAFVKQDRIWLAHDRARVRRCIEAFSFGAIDILGLPRVPLPAEFIASVIVKVVSPSNWLTACVIMSGCEWSENIILNREDPLKAETLLSHVLRVAAGYDEEVNRSEKGFKQKNAAVEKE